MGGCPGRCVWGGGGACGELR
eukprot:COSAG02_NODE_3510_length_6633_cov_16.397766_1_plen_20_part_10